MVKKRIDILLVERRLAATPQEAAALLMAGKVTVDDRRVTTPGTRVDADARIRVRGGKPYASRGGHKLAAALDAFGVLPAGRVCADVGASTGGFTDVLLQRGAAKVYAIDVAYGDLAWKLRQDPRVVVMERTNARHLQRLPEPVSLVTVDVSFISLTQILPAVLGWLTPAADIVPLVKPQFEAPREAVERGGVVRDPAVHADVLATIIRWCRAHNLFVCRAIPSPLLGPAGNREFLLHLTTISPPHLPSLDDLLHACLPGKSP